MIISPSSLKILAPTLGLGTRPRICWWCTLVLFNAQGLCILPSNGMIGMLSQLQISIINPSGSWKNTWSMSIPSSSTLWHTQSIPISPSFFSTMPMFSHCHHTCMLRFVTHFPFLIFFYIYVFCVMCYLNIAKFTWKEMWLSLVLITVLFGKYSGFSDWSRCIPIPWPTSLLIQLNQKFKHTITHTYIHTYIYIFCMRICVCVIFTMPLEIAKQQASWQAQIQEHLYRIHWFDPLICRLEKCGSTTTAATRSSCSPAASLLETRKTERREEKGELKELDKGFAMETMLSFLNGLNLFI